MEKIPTSHGWGQYYVLERKCNPVDLSTVVYGCFKLATESSYIPHISLIPVALSASGTYVIYTARDRTFIYIL